MSWISTAWHWYDDHRAEINPIVAFFGAVGTFIMEMAVAWSDVRNAHTAVGQVEIASRRHEEQTRLHQQRRITELQTTTGW